MLQLEAAIATIQGLKLWYKVSGTGPICIMPTPGWGPSSEMYFQTLIPLEAIFTLVYLDTRGTGHSERPMQASDYTYDQFAADVDALRQQLGQERIWLMGHSEAGRHALYYALQYPDHIELNAAHHAATSMSVDAFKGAAQCQWNKTNLMSRLKEIQVPTLVVVGSHDFICLPLHAHRLHVGIAGSKFILIEKAGHFPWFEQPDQFFRKVKEGLAALR